MKNNSKIVETNSQIRYLKHKGMEACDLLDSGDTVQIIVYFGLAIRYLHWTYDAWEIGISSLSLCQNKYI